MYVVCNIPVCSCVQAVNVPNVSLKIHIDCTIKKCETRTWEPKYLSVVYKFPKQ